VSDVIGLLRDVAARREAIYRYAKAHDRHDAEEQKLRSSGRFIHASIAHDNAAIALRAYRAEMDDPTPKSPQQLDHENREGQWP
jgi:hypothetical protein